MPAARGMDVPHTPAVRAPGRPAAAKPSRRGRARKKSAAASSTAGVTAANQPLEHRMLVTATMCLLAFGAVMVYSASSATSLLQGQGYGYGYLIKFVVYGGV